MTAANFEACYKRIRVYEGGNVDSRLDPGGRTSRGITQRVYDAYRSRKGQAARDVYKATDAEVKDIYRRQYWSAIRGDDLPAGVDLIVFDSAVNSGPKQAIKWLQAALGIEADGVLGMMTLDAVDADLDNDALVEGIAARRMAFLKRLRTWKTFGKGWSARVADVTSAGQAMATGRQVAKAKKGASGAPKAPEDDIAAPLISANAGTTLAGAGGGLETANEVVQAAASQVQAVSDVSDVLRWLFIALILIGIGLTVYALWHRSRSDKVMAGELLSSVTP